MKPSDREDKLYRDGKRCEIDIPENYVFDTIKNNEKEGSSLLDVGCGSGEISRLYSTNGFVVTGIDFSKVAIEISKSNNLNVLNMDIDNGFQFNDNSFDVVLAGDVIEHLFDPIFSLCEIKRVLKPNGSFYATIPYDLHLFNRKNILFGNSYQEYVYKKYRQYKHHTFFSEQLLRYMLNTAKISIKFLHYFYFNPINKKGSISKYKIFRPISKLMIIYGKVF